MLNLRSSLVKTKSNIVVARADLELERWKGESEVMANMKRLRQEVVAAIEKYKVFMDFTVDMAHAMEDFQASKEFFDVCVTFSHKTFTKGHKLGMLEYQR